jgi:hypothetical protein
MKISSPKSPKEYLRKTDHAVKHFYEGLDTCWSYYQKALQHWDITKVRQPMTPERYAELIKYLDLAGKYFDLKFSEAMFAGAILQVAYMGIRLYSCNTSIPPSCSKLVSQTYKTAPLFCVGPEHHGLPAGLIVYAARNQYNHWDDEKPHMVTKNVFNALSVVFSDNVFSDLAFEISNETICIYANEILLTALGWTTYDIYLDEMKRLLKSAVRPDG